MNATRDRHRLQRAALLVLCAALTHCAGLAPPREGHVIGAPRPAALFEPPPGRQLLIAGVDSDDPPDPALWDGQPAVVLGYTNLRTLAGMTRYAPVMRQRPVDHLMREYPDSALLLGLSVVGDLRAIVAGELDGNIDGLIALLARYQRPVFLRFGYEFDGPWNHHNPEAYRLAWRHFRERVVASGTRNIALVWHASADCGGSFGDVPIRDWYPGDDAVDWIAVSWFHPGDCRYSGPRAMAAFAREHRKPLMIAEATPKGYDLGALRFSRDGRRFQPRAPIRAWQEWFVPFLDFAQQNADVLRAVCYISAHWDASPMWGPPYKSGFWGDSRLQANPEILANWRVEMQRPAWLKGGPDLFALLGYR